MRVIFLTHYYPPEPGAPQSRISALAHGLDARGLAVTVHTGFPNYPDGVIQSPYRSRPWAIESEGGVRVLRSAVYPAPNRGFARRLANHASFALTALATAPLAGSADAVVVESPPLFLAGAATAYAGVKRAPLVLHVSDLWPESAVELGALRRPRLIAAAQALERRCYRAAAAVVSPTRGIEAALTARPEAGTKVRRIPPSVDTDLFRAAPREKGEPGGDRFRVLYAGTVGMSQGVDTLIDAATLLAPNDEIEIVIAGDGAEAPAVRKRLAGGSLGNVRMLGAVAQEQVAELYAEADAAVVLLRDRPLFRGALPTKLLEAMSAGRPVVISAAGESADLVAETASGVVVPPERPDELAKALASIARDPERAKRLGAAGRRAAVEGFAREAAVESWHELLLEVSADAVRGSY